MACSNVWDGLFVRWFYAYLTAYLSDRIPHSALQMGTPHKVFYEKDADLSYIKIIRARIDVSLKLETCLY